jgi:AAA domain
VLRDDLASRHGLSARHHIALGHRDDGTPLNLDPHATSLLISGRSGSGKSTAAKVVLEQLAQKAYSFCVVDPEGDYLDAPQAVVVGSHKNALSLDDAKQALASGNNIVLNLLGLPLQERPGFLAALLPTVEQHRLQTGQPHLLVIDEAHHMLGAELSPSMQARAAKLDRVILVTVHPELLCRPALQGVDALLVVGAEAGAIVERFAAACGRTAPAPTAELTTGQALLWRATDAPALQRITLLPSTSAQRRHNRKYAEGELSTERSFHFVGPEGKLNLRAQNLMVFLQMGDGVDDATWLHHLHAHDYSRWIATEIKDPELAADVRRIEDTEHGPMPSRHAIRTAIERRYTL